MLVRNTDLVKVVEDVNMKLPEIIYYDTDKEVTVTIDEDGHHGFFCGVPEAYLHQLCLMYGSTLEGRTQAFKELTHSVQKAGCLISESNGIIYFPTLSAKDPACVWLNAKTIYSVKAIDMHHSLVNFFKGNKIELAINVRTVKKQILRCEQFEEAMHQLVMDRQ